jgi:hypothetical protein
LHNVSAIQYNYSDSDSDTKINPLLVTYDDDGKVEGVRYMQLTSVMAKAIQEQQAEIEQLKETVNP